jgi:EpsI family protein
MSSFSGKSLSVVVLLVISIALILKIQANSAQVLENSVDMEMVPYKIDSWEGMDIPITQDVYEILETDDILLREYRDESNYPVMLLIVFSDSKRASFHPPEICYIGGGSELMAKESDELVFDDNSTLSTTKLLVKSEDYFTTVWYWFVVGDRKIGNYYWQQFSMLPSLFSSKKLRSSMVRISVYTNDALGKEKASKFVISVMPYLDRMHDPMSTK